LLATVLAVAAALYALGRGNGDVVATQTAADEAAAREARIAFFEARAAADPLDYLSLNVLAGQYLQRGRETGDVADYQRAEVAATRSLALVSKDNFTGLVLLASVRLVQHDFRSAEELAVQAKALKPYDPAPYGLLSDALVGRGQYDDAATALASMVEIDARLPALSRLAHLAFLRGDQFNAVDFWRQAIEGGNSLPVENLAWAHVQLGVTYFALGQLSDAAAEHEQALELFPAYVHALAGLGQVRAAQERYDEAIDLYSRAVARQPQPQYVAALGDIYGASGNDVDAADQYALVEAIAALYGDNGINTDLQIAAYYADHGIEPALALEMARAAYKAAPGVYAADVLAWALYQNGDVEQATIYSAKATAWGTSEPAFYYHAALISEALGDRTAALAHAERLSELNPRFNPVQAERAQKLIDELEAAR
jgi:tetratricopeptide (TPR) repeat protein